VAVTATRVTTITYSVDTVGTQTLSAASNTASPGSVEVVTMTGAATTTFTPPKGGTSPVACTIVPPAGNVATITLKGVSGDTGIRIHATDPTTIALGTTTTTFVLTISATITGMRLYWT
jgi:hypothetical protein